MKGKKETKLQLFAGILLLAVLLLFLDLQIYGIVMFRGTSKDYPTADEILSHLTVEEGTYQLDREEKEKLLRNQQFAMLLNNEGKILWSEALPGELRKKYTLQDVAKFTRYYLEDYPVRTHIVKQGLLIIGEKENQVWKYTLEYDSGSVRNFIRLMPLLLLFNILVLITVPIMQQRQNQKRREEERTEWIAGVSHDIRTPLTIILGNTDLIAEARDEKVISKYTEQIKLQGIRLRRLVENLNLSSRLSFGSGEFEKKRVVVSSLLRKTLTEIINQMEDDRYQFEIMIDECLRNFELQMNEDLMERALFNLIYNAIQHNEAGCRIVIKMYVDNKKHVFLEVADNGKGVSEGVLHMLNSRRYEWEPSKGQHGLGLKIVKKIAALHRWKISFESREERGFICLIRLL